MSNEEKYKEILKRTNETEDDFTPSAISLMIIVSYLDNLTKLGIIDSEFKMTDKGNKTMSICEEYDWKPSDTEIMNFVIEMVAPPDQLAFAFLLKRYRDDRENLINEWNAHKTNETEFPL